MSEQVNRIQDVVYGDLVGGGINLIEAKKALHKLQRHQFGENVQLSIVGWGKTRFSAGPESVCFAYNKKNSKWSYISRTDVTDILRDLYCIEVIVKKCEGGQLEDIHGLIASPTPKRTTVDDMFPEVGISCWFFDPKMGQNDPDTHPLLITDLYIFEQNLEGWAKVGARYSNDPRMAFEDTTPFIY